MADETRKEKLNDEVEAAFEAEFGDDWLASQPPAVKIAVQVLRVAVVLGALYFFLVALSVMGSAFQAIAGTTAGELFGGASQPIVGLMIGILATVLVQSSSTTTSIIVVLVAEGFVSVSNAIPMIMGANIGTSVTNTIVSLGFVDDTEAYRRGFAGATVHDMFNYLNVLVLLPVELIFAAIAGQGPLEGLSNAVLPEEIEKSDAAKAYKDSNFIKKITKPIKDEIISINKDVISDVAQGFPEANCEIGFFKFENDKIVESDDFVELCGNTSSTCEFCDGGVFDQTIYDGLKELFENAKLIKGGVFEDMDDTVGGIIALIISLVMLIGSLILIVKILTSIVKGSAKKVLTKALNYDFVGGGYLSILVGILITVAVQSSSITTSILTPLVAVGTLTVENMFPFTLGANIGTTVTGVIAALGKGERNGYQIALVHFFFNVFGVLIWFPVPLMRKLPIAMAKFLGDMAAIVKIFPVIYIFTVFIVYPLVFFGFSAGFQAGGGGAAAAGVALAIFLLGHALVIFWYKQKGGKDKVVGFIERRNERLAAIKAEKVVKTTDVANML